MLTQVLAQSWMLAFGNCPDDDSQRSSGTCIEPEREHNAARVLWETPLFPDVEVLATGHKFDLHRGLLAAASPVFRAMLEVHMHEGTSRTITIDAPLNAVRAMLEHIYVHHSVVITLARSTVDAKKCP